jgi:hypothetical protein
MQTSQCMTLRPAFSTPDGVGCTASAREENAA